MSSESGKYLAEAIKTAVSKGDLDAVSELADLFSLVCDTSTKPKPPQPKELPALAPVKDSSLPLASVPPIPSASLASESLNPVSKSGVRRLSRTGNTYRDVFWWLDFIYNDFLHYMKTVRKAKSFTSAEVYQYIRSTQLSSMTEHDLEMQPSGRERWRNIVSNALIKAAVEKTMIRKESHVRNSKRWIIVSSPKMSSIFEKEQPKGSLSK